MTMTAEDMNTDISSGIESGRERAHTSPFRPDSSKPPARSPSSEARITIKNRRKRYLDTHPEYFSSPSLELTDPLAYDRLIRRFQTPHEREAEGRRRGYSDMLESELWRSEAKACELTNPKSTASIRYNGDTSGTIVLEEKDEIPKNKDEGIQRWHKEVELMFLRGADPDFAYDEVDGNDEYDDRVLQEREEEERWFEKEEPSWAGESDQVAGKAGLLVGQTGVQDY